MNNQRLPQYKVDKKLGLEKEKDHVNEIQLFLTAGLLGWQTAISRAASHIAQTIQTPICNAKLSREQLTLVR